MNTKVRGARLFLLLGLVSILSLGTAGCGKKEQTAAPPPLVKVVAATQKDVPVSREWVGQTLGAVSSLNSLTAVVGPLIATPLLMAVSGMPQGHWAIGAPLYFGAALQALALLLAWTHFRRLGPQPAATATAPAVR